MRTVLVVEKPSAKAPADPQSNADGHAADVVHFSVPSPMTYATVMALAGLPVPRPETDAALAAEIRSDLDVAERDRDRAYLTVLLDIAEGRRPRPRTHMGTTRNVIGIIAGLSIGVRENDSGIIALAKKYNARLPGRGINMEVPRQGEGIFPRKTVLDLCEDFAMEVIEESRKFPAYAPGSSEVSIRACAEMMGLPYSRLNEKAVDYLRKVAKIVGVEDAPRKWTKSERSAYVTKVVGWIDRRIRDGLPLPCQEGNYTLVDHAQIFAANGAGPDISIHHRYKAKVAEAKAVMVPTPGGAVIDGPATFAALRAAMKFWLGEGTAPDWANLSATLTKARKAFDAAETDRLPDAFYGPCDEFVARIVAGRALTGRSLSNLERWCRAIHEHADRYVRLGGLPAPLWEAVAMLVRRSGKTQDELSEQSGIPPMTIWRMMQGPQPILASTAASMPRLEVALGASEGSLVARIGDVARSLKDGLGSDEFRSLPWRLRRLFPEGAESWDGERVLAHAETLRTKALVQDVQYSVIARNAQTLPPRPSITADMPVVEEYRLLKGHMVSPMPTDAKRHPNRRWETQSTIDIVDNLVEDFALFALLPRTLGGLGRFPEQVSLVLLLNWRNVAMWINSRAGRHAELVHKGKKLGPAITDWEIRLINMVMGWMSSRYGWITQRPDVFEAQLAVDSNTLGEPLNLRRLMVGNKAAPEQTALADSFCSFAGDAVLPADLVEKARQNWRMACVDASDDLAHMRDILNRFKTRKRKAMKPIQAIVASEQEVPLEWLSRGIRRAIAALPSARRVYRHATAVRDIIVMILLITTALRSKNLRELQFFYDCEETSTDYGGVVSYTSSGVDVMIPWDQFKNRTSTHLFGQYGDKKDYDRHIGDWLGLAPMFDYYVTKCLPVIRKSGLRSFERKPVGGVRRKRGGTKMSQLSSATGAAPRERVIERAEVENLLFPRGRNMLMNAQSLTSLVHDWTLRFVVLDEETGLPIKNLAKFGPHAIRDIVATHIVLTSDDPARFEIAADLLQTGVEQIKNRYAFRDVRRRLAKSDGFFVAVNQNFVLPAFAMAA